MRKLVNLARRAFSKPVRVILFRTGQEIRIHGLHRTGGWWWIERSVARHWTRQRVTAYRNRAAGFQIIAPDISDRLPVLLGRHDGLRELARRLAEAVEDGRFELFGTPIPALEMLDWHTDWRYRHAWKPGFFKSYDFYAPRPVPYDVKFTWELSRLMFLPPLLQAAAFGEAAERRLATVERVLRSWRRSNPLAYSVAWYPMEASMRLITLTIVLEMIDLLGRMGHAVDEAMALVLGMVAEHGEFVWRTREYSDIRGNHYAANIVALLVAGAVLHRHYPAAARWYGFAAAEIGREVSAQFLPDGVNFEKSLPYHRLVAELFLIAGLVLERGRCRPAVVTERLRAACRVMAAARRPDGLMPNLGDNDNAKALVFDDLPSRDPAPVLNLGAAVLGDAPLYVGGQDTDKDGASALSALWLCGRIIPAAEPPAAGLTIFPDGGYAVARTADAFLFVDVGEVGLAGRGGHGHNDLLSFELCLDGQPLVIDPGNPTYTGDIALRNSYRASTRHNGLTVDDHEIAPMSGVWAIADTAQPCDVETREDATELVIAAGHTGYQRLPSPVFHHRTFRLSRTGPVLRCLDRIEADGTHMVRRRLHLAPDMTVLVVEQGRVVLGQDNGRWVVESPDDAAIRIEPSGISPGYGVERPSSVIILDNQLTGGGRLEFLIRRADG